MSKEAERLLADDNEFAALLRRSRLPLYASWGEESDFPEEVFSALIAERAERIALTAQLNAERERAEKARAEALEEAARFAANYIGYGSQDLPGLCQPQHSSDIATRIRSLSTSPCKEPS